MKYSFNYRTKILFLFVLLFGLVLIGRLFLLQVVNASHYTKTANSQFTPEAPDVFERGAIYFTQKDGTLVSGALQSTGSKVFINPTKIPNPKEIFEKLSTIFDLDEGEFLAKAGKAGDIYEEIAWKLGASESDKIKKEKLPG